jgi:mRNA interferase RelE/StbE
MTYRIDWRPTALKALQALPNDTARRIARKVSALADDPRPNGSEELAGGEDEYRIRAGGYRVIYGVDDGAVIVLVLRIGHRREVYRR